MEGRKKLLFSLLCLAVTFSLAMPVTLRVEASSATIYVPDAYSTIQAAVDGASPGDTITVRDGTYEENVDVDKRLTIRSENGAGVTFVEAAHQDDVFHVTADYINISGFTIRGETGGEKSAISLHGSATNNVQYCNISNNIISETFVPGYGYPRPYHGISLYYTSNTIVENNKVYESWIYAIQLYQSENNTLAKNTVSESVVGIRLAASRNNTLSNNVAKLNDTGISLTMGSFNNTFVGNAMAGNDFNFNVDIGASGNLAQNIDTSNTVNGKPIYYLVNKSDLLIDSGWNVGYLGLVDCDNITVKDVVLSHNGQGVLLASTNNSRIENVDASNNGWGFALNYSSNNTLVNNTADSASGFFLRYSSNNTITANTLSNGGYAMWLFYSSNGNMIYLNNFVNNFYGVVFSDALKPVNNVWNSPAEITYTYDSNTYTNYLGNYWSDYTGIDVDADGIGDTSYSVDSDSDNYPLMEPFENYQMVLGGSISGHVYQSDGTTPIMGAMVGVFDHTSPHNYGWVSTDTDGTYTFAGLVTGQYVVRVEADGYAVEWYDGVIDKSEATTVSVSAPNDTSDIDFTLELGGSILGHVYEFNGTTPIGGAQIDVFDYDLLPGEWVVYETAWTRPDGSYKTAGLPTGVYGVRVKADGYAVEWYDNSYDALGAMPVSVTVPDDTYGIDFSLKPWRLRVVVDPGHGGSHYGTVGWDGSGYPNEKDYNLKVALELRDLLEGYVDVLITRETDITVNIQDRFEFANSESADLFVSIHFNAGPEERQGTETYMYDYLGKYFPAVKDEGEGTNELSNGLTPEREMRRRDTSYELARFVQDSLICQLDTRDQGIKSDTISFPGALGVLRRTKMPAILIEVAFLTNEDEFRLFTTGEGTAVDPYEINEESVGMTAQGIANGIIKYMLERGLTITGYSPVDMVVTDPDGLTISKQLNEIPNATYTEADIDGDGDVDGQIRIPDKKIGDYVIAVIPEPDALPTDTYTLEVSLFGMPIVVAQDVQVSEIPNQVYIVRSTETTITQIVQATVDFDPDTFNLGSGGKMVTVYIELPTGYDVGQVEVSSIILNGVVAALDKPTQIGDYDGDSVNDLMVKFDRVTVQEILTIGDEVEIMISGEVSGIAFEGNDIIRVIDKGNG